MKAGEREGVRGRIPGGIERKKARGG